jgi:heptose-I-phosphate ethanolaminephosphotransferase
MSSLKKVFIKAISLLPPPIEKEFPFLILFFLLIAFPLIKNLLATLVASGIFISEVLTPICLAFFISYIFTIVVYYSHRHWVKVLLYTIGCVVFSVDTFLWLEFHKSITPEILTLIGETNSKEASEFLATFLFNLKGALCILLIVLFITIICIVEKKRSKIYLFLNRNRIVKGIIYMTTFSVSIIAICCSHVYDELFTSKIDQDINVGAYNDSFTATVFALRSVAYTTYEMKSAIRQAKEVKGGTIKEKDSLNVILIIGESYIKHHAQLYGYPLPTTPRLMNEKNKGNLYVFNNVVTPYNYTTYVIKNALCCNSIANDESWYNTPFVPTIFKRSGMKVDNWDNQRTNSSKIISIWDFTLNSFLFNNTICDISYDRTAPHAFKYDDQLVSDYARSKNKDVGKYNFIIFHLMGQHIDAKDRYPHDKFSRFSAKDIRNNAPYMTESKKQDIANYDNATYYNDYVVNHIIDLYREKNTVVVYFSDHGEEVYDYRDSKGRVEAVPGQEKEWLRYQFEVPFVIWCSDKYKALHPDVVRRIKASLNRPFMTDNTCHLLFDLAGLKTSYYRPERDLISPKFKPSKRIVQNNIDFDAVMSNKWEK